jgi:type IV secretion system protein VirD4
MKNTTKRKIKNSIALVFLASLFTYFASAGMKTINEMSKFQDNVLNPETILEFLKTTDSQTQMIIGIAVLLLTWFVGSNMEFRDKKYQDASSFGVHGTSRWGKVEELKEGKAISINNKISLKDPFKTLKVEDGIVLAKDPIKNELIILPENTTVDNSNVCLIGASGSGKGQAVVYNNLINNRKKTIIVTDPKGELFHGTHQLKRDQGYEVFQVDFLNLNQAKYNPLDYVEKDIDAKKIAEAIAKNSAKDGKEDFFFTTARDLLTGLIIYCKSINDMASIPVDVKQQFYKVSEDENYLFNLCSEIGFEHPAYAYLKDASVADGKTRTSILSSFAQQTAIFSLQDVATMTTRSDFNFHDFQSKKSILYVKIPMKSNPVEALTATFFDQLFSVFYDIADKYHGILPKKTMFLLDEFANLGKINDYEGILSTCRGLGIGVITIVQDLAQLENKYGKEITRSIINNHDTKLFLRTGDTETAKYFSGLAGETTAKMSTKSTSQSGGIFSNNSSSSKSQQEQYVKRPLITDGELMTIDKDTCYLFISGYFPLKLEKAWQYKIYKNFLFDENRQVNYINNREKYLKMIGKTEEIQVEEELPKTENVAAVPDVEPIEYKDQEIEQIEESNVIEEVAVSKEEEILEDRKEKIETLIQEFLMSELDQEDLVSAEIIIEEERNNDFINDNLLEDDNQENSLQELEDLMDGMDGFDHETYKEAEGLYSDIEDNQVVINESDLIEDLFSGEDEEVSIDDILDDLEVIQ